MYRVEDGDLYYESRRLGPADRTYIDYREGSLAACTDRQPKFCGEVRQLPEGDIVFTTVPDNRVVGIESKRPDDLSNSQRNRRLQDELDRMRRVVDIPLLGLRLQRGFGAGAYTFNEAEEITLVQELAKWVNFGGLVFLPAKDEAVLSFVRGLRTSFTPGQHIYSIVSGRPKPKKTGSPFSIAVQGMGLRIGPARAATLETFYDGNFMRFIQAPEEEIHELVKSKTVVERLRALRGTG